ncbi:MAG: hypothetical protein ACFFCS_05610 [Candidatus Hodarchaeota archaeon]
MQAITHFLAGIFINALIVRFIPLVWLQVILIIVFGILSHAIIDTLTYFTYHPPDAPKPITSDKFWLVWHGIVFLGSAVVLIYYWNLYWLGMGAAVLPDLYDWLFIRPVRSLKKDPDFMKGKDFHPFIDNFREKYLPWIPNWTHKRRGIIPELIIWSFCFIVVEFLL